MLKIPKINSGIERSWERGRCKTFINYERFKIFLG